MTQGGVGAESGLLLFQEGIPGTFFPYLLQRGHTIVRFPQAAAAAHAVFRSAAGARAIFFRANFTLGATELDLLPRLALAALVSTGTDNVDSAALAERQINLVTGDGANARAVFDYVIQALLLGGLLPQQHSIGVLGTGRIGQRLIRFFRETGVRFSWYDPFIAETGSLGAVLSSDFITCHVNLHGGEHATAGMLDAGFFTAAQKKIRIIQTCRGGIWQKDFYATLPSAAVEILAQDVYPDEPPAAAAVARAKFSTPHIAGYSTLGRLGGIVHGIRALHPDFSATGFLPPGAAWFLDREAENFTQHIGNFNALRDQYPWRKEFHEYNAAEQLAFRARFPHIGTDFFAPLWRND